MPRTVSNLEWVGPFRLSEFLLNPTDKNKVWPGEGPGIYLATKGLWQRWPSGNIISLYVGKSKCLIVRIGDLVADILGLYANHNVHDPGGYKTWEYAKALGENPLDYYLGWVNGCSCPECDEDLVRRELKPLLNKRSTTCKAHGTSNTR